MRRFTANILLAMLPIVMMAGVNYTRDPAGLFGGGLEARIAALLADGHAVRDPGDYNARLVSRYYVQRLRHPPDVLVLGSSRAMHIRASAFPGRTMINEAVFSATVEDFVATLGMYDSAGLWPSDVVLELGPWLLNAFNGYTGWRSIAAEYEYMSRRIGIDPSRLLPTMRPDFDRYFALFSPAYFQAAIRTRPAAAQKRRAFSAPDAPAEEAVLLSDGSRLDSRSEREKSRVDLDRAVLRDLSPPISGLEHFAALAPEPERALELMVRFLRGRGVRVTIVLMPYHPLMKSVFDSRAGYAMVAQAERRFHALARRLEVPIRGAYNPAACGCSELDFVDGVHPNAACSQRALNAGPF